MRVVVVGAGVGGLACAVRLADAGHEVTVVEQGAQPGGKAGRLERDGWRFDTGPSLLTMPWVVRDLLGDAVELVRVEPISRYRFADGSTFDMSADLPTAMERLEAFSPGAGADWLRFLGACAAMWRAAAPVLTGPPPWPPRRPRADLPRPGPGDLLRVRPWMTLRDLARAYCRDPRLQLVVERFATYAGADPRRAPAALAVAGYVEHTFGAWHVRGGLYRIVEALAERLVARRGALRCGVRAAAVLRSGRRTTGVRTDAGVLPADAVVWNGDALALQRALGRPARRREPSLSGLALMLGLRDATPNVVHHTITFSADYEAELETIFGARRPPDDPTVYVSASCATDPGDAPPGAENWFVLVNQPAGIEADWLAVADRLIARLGVGERVVHRALRTPVDLERETGALGGAIYGDAPHGRLSPLRRAGPVVGGVPGLYRVGGTVHPGGGLPLVMLGAAQVAREIASAA